MPRPIYKICILLLIFGQTLQGQVFAAEKYWGSFQLKKPILRSLLLIKDVFPQQALCDAKHTVYLQPSKLEIKNKLGLSVNTRIVSGAGNSSDRPAFYASLNSDRPTVENLRRAVLTVKIDDDPKFIFRLAELKKCQ